MGYMTPSRADSDGVITIKEVTTPTAKTDSGQVYTKTDNNLYFQDGAGTEQVVLKGGLTLFLSQPPLCALTQLGCAALAQVELSNGPEIKVLDFDASSDEFAQFTVAFPKSWNEEQ